MQRQRQRQRRALLFVLRLDDRDHALVATASDYEELGETTLDQGNDAGKAELAGTQWSLVALRENSLKITAEHFAIELLK